MPLSHLAGARLLTAAALTTLLLTPAVGLPGAHASTARVAAPATSLRLSSVSTSLQIRPQVSSSMPARARVVVEAPTSHPAGTMLVKTTTGRILAKKAIDRGSRTASALRLASLSPGTHRLVAVFRAADGAGASHSAKRDVRAVPGCDWSPHVCGFPDATNTGVPVPGSKLRTIHGDVDLRKDGAVLRDTIVTGHVNISADNVTVRNVRILTTAATTGASGCSTRRTPPSPTPRSSPTVPGVWGSASRTSTVTPTGPPSSAPRSPAPPPASRPTRV